MGDDFDKALGFAHAAGPAGTGKRICAGVNSPIFQMIVSNALEGDYSGLKFSLGNGEKDLRYYNRMAEAAGLTNSLGRNLHHTFVQGLKLGFEDSYVGSLIEAQAKLNNVNIIDK